MLQSPPVLDGVTLNKVIEEIVKRSKKRLSRGDFDSPTLDQLKTRSVNDGFSGGEVKLSEMYQLLHTNASLYLIDEPESGVDLENVHVIGHALKKRLNSGTCGSIIVTHSGALAKHINHYKIFVLNNRKIVEIKNIKLEQFLKNIEAKGFVGGIDEFVEA